MRIVFALILSSLFIYAQTINQQIHALEEATPAQRVTLMNGIKEQLISMNEELRMQTIETLRERLQHTNETEHEGNEQEEHLDEESTLEHDVDLEHPAEMIHHNEAMEIHDALHQQEHHSGNENKHPHENQIEVGEK